MRFGGSNTLSVKLRETIYFVTILRLEKNNGGSRAFSVSGFASHRKRITEHSTSENDPPRGLRENSIGVS